MTSTAIVKETYITKRINSLLSHYDYRNPKQYVSVRRQYTHRTFSNDQYGERREQTFCTDQYVIALQRLVTVSTLSMEKFMAEQFIRNHCSVTLYSGFILDLKSYSCA
jgi:hypothetical protein